MSKVIRILLVTSFLAMFMATTVFAEGKPVGNCSTGFTLHMVADHDNHHGHHVHVGSDTDQNGDGYICVKPITPKGTIHVHIDNNVLVGPSK